MIVFIHIERTGGSTLHNAILPHFPARSVTLNIDPDSIPKVGHKALLFLGQAADVSGEINRALSAREGNLYIAGHVVFPLLGQFLRARTAEDILFSTTRNPIERAASLRAIVQQKPHFAPALAELAKSRPFADFYAAAVDQGALAPNRQCFALSGRADFDHTMKVLREHYNVLGTHRYYAAFQTALEPLLQQQIPGFQFSRLRAHAAFHQPSGEGDWTPVQTLDALIDDATRKRIERDNEHDLELIRFLESEPDGVFVNTPRPKPVTTTEAPPPIAVQAPAVQSAPKKAVHRAKRCVLHIGSEATGLRAIRRYLSANREALAQQGVIMPSKSEEAVADDDTTKTLVARIEHALLACAKPQTILVTHDLLRLRPGSADQIRALRARLEPFADEFRIVLDLSRQDRVCLDHFHAQLHAGRADVQPLPDRPADGLDYARLHATWAEVFGADAIEVRVAGKSGDAGALVAGFCAAAGIPDSGTPAKKGEARTRATLSLAGADFLAELNRQMPLSAGDRKKPSRERLVAFLERHHHGMPVSREQVEQFMAPYRESNENLRQRVFPERPTGLFDDDYGMYPDSLAGGHRRYADAVAIAIALWWARDPLPTQPRQPLLRTLARIAQWLYSLRPFARAARQPATKRALRAENRFLAGRLALSKGQNDKAHKLFRKALELDPKHQGARDALRLSPDSVPTGDTAPRRRAGGKAAGAGEKTGT